MQPNWKVEADALEMQAFQVLHQPRPWCSWAMYQQIMSDRRREAEDLERQAMTYYKMRWRRKGWR